MQTRGVHPQSPPHMHALVATLPVKLAELSATRLVHAVCSNFELIEWLRRLATHALLTLKQRQRKRQVEALEHLSEESLHMVLTSVLEASQKNHLST